jgi:hypothetical protein
MCFAADRPRVGRRDAFFLVFFINISEILFLFLASRSFALNHGMSFIFSKSLICIEPWNEFSRF